MKDTRLGVRFGEQIRRHAFHMIDQARGEMYNRHVRELDAAQNLPSDELKLWQMGRLYELLCHARDTTRFYRLLVPRDFAPGDSWDVLSELPIVNHEMVGADPAAFFSSTYSHARSWEGKTSGTNGLPLSFWMDRSRRTRVLAELAYFGSWAGYRVGDRHMFLRPAYSDPPKRASGLWLRNQVLVDVSRLHDEKLAEIVQLIADSRSKVLFGYSWTIDALAAFIRRSRKRLAASRKHLQSIVSIGGPLTGHSRTRLEKVLGCPVFERYSASEVGTIAGECEMHRLHLNVGSLHTELMPYDFGPLSEGDRPDTLLATDLFNFAMPFLRYDLRDAVRFDHGECECGRKSPLVRAIHGRVMDQIISPEKEWIDPVSIAVEMGHIAAIRHFQFSQETESSYIIRVVPGKGFALQTERDIAKKFQRFLGPSATIEVRAVDEIPLQPSGKRLFVINNLQRNKMIR